MLQIHSFVMVLQFPLHFVETRVDFGENFPGRVEVFAQLPQSLLLLYLDPLDVFEDSSETPLELLSLQIYQSLRK